MCVGWPPDSCSVSPLPHGAGGGGTSPQAQKVLPTHPPLLCPPPPPPAPARRVYSCSNLKISAQPDPLLRMPSSDSETPPILQAQLHHLPEMPWSPQPHSAREYPHSLQNQTWPAALSPLAVQSSPTQAGTPVPPGATSAGPAHRRCSKLAGGVESRKQNHGFTSP